MCESGRTNTNEGTQLRPEGQCGGAEITDRVSGERRRDPISIHSTHGPGCTSWAPAQSEKSNAWSSGRGCAHEWGRGSDVGGSAEIKPQMIKCPCGIAGARPGGGNRRYDKVPEPIEARGAQREMGRKGNWGARELLGRKGIGAQRELGRKGNWGAKEAKSFGQGCRTPLSW